jgi:hypothetical protein
MPKSVQRSARRFVQLHRSELFHGLPDYAASTRLNPSRGLNPQICRADGGGQDLKCAQSQNVKYFHFSLLTSPGGLVGSPLPAWGF